MGKLGETKSKCVFFFFTVSTDFTQRRAISFIKLKYSSTQMTPSVVTYLKKTLFFHIKTIWQLSAAAVLVSVAS